jgi:hypothetical protein
MAVDSELKALLDALVEGQLKLAEVQQRFSEGLQRLAEGQQRHGERLDRVEAALERLTVRVEAFTDAVLRGFTDAAGRDRALDSRVEKPESRMQALERGKPA